MYTSPLSLQAYKDRYAGQEVLVIAAGPSAPLYRRLLDNCFATLPKIATIKQAYNFVDLDSDFHFFNSLNCMNYYIKERPEKLLSVFQDDKDMKKQFNNYDIRLEVRKDRNNPWQDCLALNHSVGKYSIENRGIYRPWGPGIMLESVFYLLEYMGFSTINTIGFDVAEADGSYRHCYQPPVKSRYRTDDIDTYNYLRHISGLSYNTGHGPMKNPSFDEVVMIKKLLPVFHDWLLSQGTKLNIYTTSRFMIEYDFVHDIP